MKTIEINPTADSVSRDILEIAKDPATVSTAYSQATIDYLNARQEIYANKKPGFLSRRNISFTIFGSLFTLVSVSLLAPSIKWTPGKSEPTISDTEKDKTGNWPEGYKPSALQLELQKMLPPFPPKEITDAKLTEEQRDEKYEEAIFKVFKDSKVPATEEMTERLKREVNKFSKICLDKGKKGGDERSDGSSSFTNISNNFSYVGYPKIDSIVFLVDFGNKKKYRLQLSVHSDNNTTYFGDGPFIKKIEGAREYSNVIRQEGHTDSFYEYLLSFSGEHMYVSVGNDKVLLGPLSDAAKLVFNTRFGNSMMLENGFGESLKNKIKNTILAIVLLSNDTFDLDKYDENGNLLPVKIDKEELKKRISRTKISEIKAIKPEDVKEVGVKGISTVKVSSPETSIKETLFNDQKNSVIKTDSIRSSEIIKEAKNVSIPEIRAVNDVAYEIEEDNMALKEIGTSTESTSVKVEEMDSREFVNKLIEEIKRDYQSESEHHWVIQGSEGVKKKIDAVLSSSILDDEDRVLMHLLKAKSYLSGDLHKFTYATLFELQKARKILETVSVSEDVRSEVEALIILEEFKFKRRKVANLEMLNLNIFPDKLSFAPGKTTLMVSTDLQVSALYDKNGLLMRFPDKNNEKIIMPTQTGRPLKDTHLGLYQTYSKKPQDYVTQKGARMPYTQHVFRLTLDMGQKIKKNNPHGIAIFGVAQSTIVQIKKDSESVDDSDGLSSVSGYRHLFDVWNGSSYGAVGVNIEMSKFLQDKMDMGDYMIVFDKEIPKSKSLEELINDLESQQTEYNKTIGRINFDRFGDLLYKNKNIYDKNIPAKSPADFTNAKEYIDYISKREKEQRESK